MYVCLCNGIRDSELEELGKQGLRSAKEAYQKLDAELSCSCCKEEAEEILTASSKERQPHLTLIAS